MEPYQPFLDLTSALNCHLEPQPAWLDASMPESDALDYSAQLQFVAKPLKPAKKTSGQRSSSVAILDSPSLRNDPDLTEDANGSFRCVCGT